MNMATTTKMTNEHIRELTREEGRALLDREARRYLGMSADEFIQAWESGKFADNPDQSDVMYVALLLPFAQ
jgi:DNA-directed RNA polymerase specialized sigma subunit